MTNDALINPPLPHAWMVISHWETNPAKFKILIRSKVAFEGFHPKWVPISPHKHSSISGPCQCLSLHKKTAFFCRQRESKSTSKGGLFQGKLPCSFGGGGETRSKAQPTSLIARIINVQGTFMVETFKLNPPPRIRIVLWTEMLDPHLRPWFPLSTKTISPKKARPLTQPEKISGIPGRKVPNPPPKKKNIA